MNASGLTTRRAFSLIEVLIAVLVLAIGLLGLGAVIPVIVREQRIASEATLAISTVNSARAYLDAADIPWGDPAFLGDASSPADEETLTGRLLMNAPTSAWVPLAVDPETGASTERAVNSPPIIEIPLAERLYPTPRSGGLDPRLVWDVAVRRVADRDWRDRWNSNTTTSPVGTAEPILSGADKIQLAIFVRLLDPGIRVRPGESIKNLLVAKNTVQAKGNPWNASANIWPVAINERTGVPTRNGRGVYSIPIAAPLVTYDFSTVRTDPEWMRPEYLKIEFQLDDDRDLMPLSGPSNEISITAKDLAAFASQPGQKLVDAWGRVYTVLGPAPRTVAKDSKAPIVRIDPPVPNWIQNTLQLGDLCFTPQVPAEVILLEVEQ